MVSWDSSWLKKPRRVTEMMVDKGNYLQMAIHFSLVCHESIQSFSPFFFFGVCEFGRVSQCHIGRTQWIVMVGRGIIHEDRLFRWRFPTWHFSHWGGSKLLNPHSDEQVVYIHHTNMLWEYTTSIHVSILLMASALHRRAPVSCRRSPLGPVNSFFHSFCVRFDLLNAELLTFLF